ncbi:trans-1,2-dihydrobenzene-1,2-diol dehydrogenase [Monodelphis domestica]|uniref:trans-1,2-dihydrobenzene-1,2-diol dehydrogenase n=1 Tax=Monodelphis domestica TaxID=13616 RepID=UPI0024E1CED4|nr:trans-1,2-dihydrobenzene-1,2-diol dehydrogenase [Monodelphis domestica]XP_056652753.1 trans-1,2-dihydrobenzene-1,2-diol dehydrogenase [Monodelphis domestica]
MARALRWGVMSAGLISHDFVTALRSLPRSEHQVVAVAARDLGRAQDFARRHDIPKAYGSYEDLLRKEPDVDVVYVGTQNPQHFQVVLQSLEAGKPVLCEKPLGVTAAEVREMVAAARARGLFLMEAIWTRFFPATEALRAVLAQGTLGEVRLVRADFGVRPGLNFPARVTDWAQAGGGLLDLGIYCLQFVSLVAGAQRPEKIHAVGLLHEKGVDDTVTVALQYPSGLQASFSSSITTVLPNSLHVFGTQGQAQIPSTMWCPTELLVNGERAEFPLPAVANTETFNYPKSIGLVYEAQHVRQCLLQGLKESSVMPLAESELLADILEEVRRQIGLRFSQDRT